MSGLGQPLFRYAEVIGKSAQVADHYGLWLAHSSWEAEIKWYTAWKTQLPELDKPHAYQPSIVCIASKILKDIDESGAFVMHPAHPRYYEHVRDVSTRRRGAAPPSVIKASKTAETDPLYATERFHTVLNGGAELKVEVVGMMIETILAPYLEEAYDVLAHVMGGAMPLHTIVVEPTRIDGVRQAIMENVAVKDCAAFALATFPATREVPATKRYQYTGRCAEDTSMFACAQVTMWEYDLLRKGAVVG